jgi:hypothetical protein
MCPNAETWVKAKIVHGSSFILMIEQVSAGP